MRSGLRCWVCRLDVPACSGGYCPECGGTALYAPRAQQQQQQQQRPAPKAAPKPTAPAEPVSPVFVRSLGDAAPLEFEAYPGELAALLGGSIKKGARVLIAGPPQSGKSTAAAELAFEAWRRHRRPAYWLDRDQMDDSLIVENFRIAGVTNPAEVVQIVSARPSRDPAYRPIGWREAVAVVPRKTPVIVVDSLPMWASGPLEQAAMIAALKELEGIVVLIDRTNKEGEIAGRMAPSFDADAVVLLLNAHEAFVQKVRGRAGYPRKVERVDRFRPAEAVIN